MTTSTTYPIIPIPQRQARPARRWWAIVGRIISNLVLVVAVLAFGLLVILPHMGAARALTVLSDSMKPGFGRGDLVIATPLAAKDLRAGHVIVYQAPIDGNPVVVHRVKKVLSRGSNPVVQTKGDASSAVDPWKARLGSEQLWQQRFALPKVGLVIRALRSEKVSLVGTKLLPLLLLLMGLSAIWRPSRRVQEPGGAAAAANAKAPRDTRPRIQSASQKRRASRRAAA